VSHANPQKSTGRPRVKRAAFWLAAGLLGLLLVLASQLYATIDKPWRSGVQSGEDFTGSFSGSPLTEDGAQISARASGNGPSRFGYALQRAPGTPGHYSLTFAEGTLTSGDMVVTLTAYDGWQRLDRVRRHLQGPADLGGLRLDLQVPARARLVEFMVGGRPGTDFSLHTVQLRETAPPSTGSVSGGVLYEEAMRIIAAHALHADRLPPDYRAQWQPAPQATPAEARLAVKQVLNALGDRHSFMMDPSRHADLPQVAKATFKPARWEVVEEGIGYVEVPGFIGTDPDLRNAYATFLVEALQAGSRRGVRAWVVDLRGNGGGNMWPMLAGLEPLLRGQSLGFFEGRDGSRRAWRNDPPPAAAAVPSMAQVPVAVLTSGRTASSGEAVAIAFRGRSATRSFGAPTYGVPTANAAYTLQDGTLLLLTGARFIDRLGKGDGGPLTPDEAISDLGVANRSQVAAVAWLRAERTRGRAR
jgi:hypothetical protein